MKGLKIIGIIPARLESSRLSKKLLLEINKKTLIQRVYENSSNLKLFHEIYIATDSKEIEDTCYHFNANVIKTSNHHTSGTSRIAEAIKDISADIIVNIQGDEPFIIKNQIKSLIDSLIKSKFAEIATLYYPCSDYQLSKDPNIVKTVKDLNSYALYFSRNPIPFRRNENQNGTWLHHLGVYAYKRKFLEQYPFLKDCLLEQMEQLEQLRFLTNGYKILLVETKEPTLGIDTQEDFEKAKQIIEELEG
ncbi:3-deoxy-D-manno-octulosonate cytidylyltransferase [bacterium B13(2017)]|nr:3-deoxy-D-manno-octulosonate cytidylyltransferase [bacterium B13(2017)]